MISRIRLSGALNNILILKITFGQGNRHFDRVSDSLSLNILYVYSERGVEFEGRVHNSYNHGKQWFIKFS